MAHWGGSAEGAPRAQERLLPFEQEIRVGRGVHAEFRSSNLEDRGSRLSGLRGTPSAAPGAKNGCVWTPGGVRGPTLSRFSVSSVSTRPPPSGVEVISPGALLGCGAAARG